MIWKNFFRELFYITSRLLSAIIITAVAVLIYVALSGIMYNSDRIMENYFKEQNVADYWITGINFNFDYNDCKNVQNIHGVIEVQPRNLLTVEDKDDENITLILYGIEGTYNINTPLIIEGNFPKSNREIMMSYAFAKENNLNIGDTYDMKIKGTDNILKKQICALIKNPECMYHISSTLLQPNFKEYGFAYINNEALEDIIGPNIYSQICITVENNVIDTEIKNEINHILRNKVTNILALEDNISAYNLNKQINGLRPIAYIFPIAFFLVAILIMFSTMSRLIENSRTSIGTFKALGYSDSTILIYYLSYSILVVILGFIIGVIPATRFVTTPIVNVLISSLNMPSYELLTDKLACIISFSLACIFCIGTAFVVVNRALAEKPAECMRPKPPKKSRKTFLESMSFIWNRLSFSQKYIFRSIFRNRIRMVICIIGISGCMTLILTAFSIKNSITHYLDMLSNNQLKYDMAINFKPNPTDSQYQRFNKMDIITETQYEMTTNAKIYSSYKLETSVITVTEDVISLKLIGVFDPSTYVLPENGIIIDENIANKLDYTVGNIAIIKFIDSNKYYEMTIASILPDINGIYISKTYWRTLGRKYIPTDVYVKTTDIEALENKLSNYDFVLSYKANEAYTQAITEQVSSLATVVYILILFGAILEIVVLYNLGIMSFYEQTRNLATLLVLGFHNSETRKLLLTENIIYAIIGIIIGIPLGLELAGFVLSLVSNFSFVLHVYPLSYLISITLTLIFAMLINLILGNKMKNIDMLASLKSVE